MTESFDDESARTIRTHWFRYLDTIEPMRAELYGFCHQLSRNVWDAEDLVQETLLTGFGMTARGDFHGENSQIKNAKAYLFRSATNRWLDLQRYRSKFNDIEHTPERATEDSDLVAHRDALNKTIALTSPQEFVAFLLKDVYDFTLEEIADFIGTTEGTVKSALSRARKKIAKDTDTSADPTQRALVDLFVSALNSGNVDNVIELMAEQVQIKVCNVGGGRGRDGIWSSHLDSRIGAERAEVDGVAVVLMFFKASPETLFDVLRVDGGDRITRITDYCYAPETLHYVADKIGRNCEVTDYHQPWNIIEDKMVPTTNLPWLDNQRD